MRLGVISDVHGNLHALDAALAFLAGQRVDAYLCAGDVVGYGPFPNECVRRIVALPGRCVAGNHELIVLGRLSDSRCVPIARDSLRWTGTVLDAPARAAIAALPDSATLADIAVHHGSVGDPQAYLETEEQARAALRALGDAAAAPRILIVGHTHRPMAVSERRGSLLRGTTGEVTLEAGDRVLLNPGAVGQSRGRSVRAQVMVLDVGAGRASFHALRYDVAGCRRALRERGLPARSLHLRPPAWRVVARGARRGMRRVGARLTTSR